VRDDEEVAMDSRAARLYPEIERYLFEVTSELDRIPDERRLALDRLAGFVTERATSGRRSRFTFICTHNSRRSQMAQIWAQTAAARCGVPAVETFSGGTEATAFNQRAVAAMRRAGFRIDDPNGGDNPVCRVRFADGGEPMECFSKLYHTAPNPDRDFCAVMTCSAAEAACPIVLGAAERISLPYDDPGLLDGSDLETAAYDERCRQIACEMLAVFSRVRG
jgi:protein-tyrosine phosphatase/arsenate reductase